MSEEQLKVFLEMVKADTSLQKKSREQLMYMLLLLSRRQQDFASLLMTSLRLNLNFQMKS
jgi:hypothetical protein